jgi:hypothetical protein
VKVGCFALRVRFDVDHFHDARSNDVPAAVVAGKSGREQNPMTRTSTAVCARERRHSLPLQWRRPILESALGHPRTTTFCDLSLPGAKALCRVERRR